MKTIFDRDTREAIIGRIRNLKQDSPRQWGKMTPYQMTQHCIRWEDLTQGKKKYKQAFIGRVFGKYALNKFIKDERPLGKNTPTLPELKMTGEGDIEPEKKTWISLLDSYAQYPLNELTHPFFGKMTREQIGWMVYKHIDHHLRQFNC